MPAPEKSIVEINDVDTETPGQDVQEKNDFERTIIDLKSKSKQNTQIMKSYLFLLQFNLAIKLKITEFDIQVFNKIHILLIVGFKESCGEL